MFVKNIEDDILFLNFYPFLGRFPYLKLISHILLSYFCYIYVDHDFRGLKFSCNPVHVLRMLYYNTIF